mmetsp:Transcript_32517/g.105194  ORF Transcript_32517/g.105194 Transcript_32517/m.105194 type:complete len:355 (-) Transcript_32517:84-1148(-)
MRILSSLILLLSGIAGGGSQAQPVPTEPPTVARPAARRLSVSWLSAAGGCIAHGGNAGSYVDSWHMDPTVCQFECAAEPGCFGVQESDHSRGHRCRKMLSQPTGAIPLGGASCLVKDTAETRRVWRGRIEIVAPPAASPAASPSASAGGCALSQNMIQGSFASCYFELKTMDNIDMTGADLGRAVFSFATVRYLLAEGTVFTNAFFEGAKASGGRFARADFTGAQCKGADFSDSAFTEATLTGALLVEANFKGCVMSKATLKNADASNGNFRGVDFSGGNIRGVKFEHSDLRGASFFEADLTGASFKDAELRGVTWDRAKGLDTVDFVGAVAAPDLTKMAAKHCSGTVLNGVCV